MVAECGTGKTLISLGGIHVHSQGKPYTALAMVPPHLVEKWAREAFLTLPGIRVFLIDDLRNGGDENKRMESMKFDCGRATSCAKASNESQRTAIAKVLPDSPATLAVALWTTILVHCRPRTGEARYFWRHAYRVARSGPNVGCVVNSETGKPVIIDESRFTLRISKGQDCGDD